eukprot:93516-Pyramimonas_sp.AAC.1
MQEVNKLIVTITSVMLSSGEEGINFTCMCASQDHKMQYVCTAFVLINLINLIRPFYGGLLWWDDVMCRPHVSTLDGSKRLVLRRTSSINNRAKSESATSALRYRTKGNAGQAVHHLQQLSRRKGVTVCATPADTGVSSSEYEALQDFK